MLTSFRDLSGICSWEIFFLANLALSMKLEDCAAVLISVVIIEGKLDKGFKDLAVFFFLQLVIIR